jgi:DNA mismatch repair protein MutS2
MLSSNCLSDIGREKVEEISFLTDYQTLDYQLELVVEFLRIVREHDNFPTSHF